MEDEPKLQDEEAIRLKSLAQDKFINSNLKSALKYAKKAQDLFPSLEGISELVTSFTILRVAAQPDIASSPDWYKILQVEPFAHINTIKKQYKKLALILHPDKNHYLGSEEAFKLVGDAFRFLSDKIRRKEYDTKLRIRIQAEGIGGSALLDTFWTACSRCRLLHQFERKYLGQNLMCPNCRRSFKAVEAEANDVACENTGVRVSRPRVGNRGQSSVSFGEWSGGRLRSGGLRRTISGIGEVQERRRRKCSVGEILERSLPKRAKAGEDKLTLAEMQLQAKRKANEEKLVNRRNKEKEEGHAVPMEIGDKDTETGGNVRKGEDIVYQRRGGSRKSVSVESERLVKNEDVEIMPVEDSDFYDFDKDRTERSFKKGQVWAVYDDDDGMPRHYGLIDEVLSVNPFHLKMSWLDIQSKGDERLICWEKMGFHVSCGRFKVAKTTSIDSVNIFSHVMGCERAAREDYLIYPKKGSIWALYNEGALDTEERNTTVGNKHRYDIVVFLTTYSEIHGLSMAYLDKVHGFKTIFKRREIGCHAIKWFEKDDVRLFSHQIPARKLSGDEVTNNLKDCWELDPASLPSDLLSIGWR